MINRLSEFIPETSVSTLEQLFENYSGQLKIVSPRSTKLGDFRVNYASGECSISINNNLNPYSFLITLVHELAHYHVWKNHGRAAKPHGKEWQSTFQKLLEPFIESAVFPADLEASLKTYLEKPKASSCSDVDLVKALNQYDPPSELIYISDLKVKSTFMFKNRGQFSILGKVRTRIKCKHVKSGRNYLFSPVTLVSPCLADDILV